MPRRGVIYTVALPSAISIPFGAALMMVYSTYKRWRQNMEECYAGTITSWSKISIMDAGHFDVNTAYAAVNRIRVDDLHPHIYKTHDGGKTWKEIVTGFPDDPINVVREDPIERIIICRK